VLQVSYCLLPGIVGSYGPSDNYIMGMINTHWLWHVWLVYGHFGPKTLRTQDISALCVWCQNVSHFCTGAEMSNGHFGTSAEVSRTVRH